MCFKDNFNKFHTNLQFNHNKKRLIDEYGFEFPHDYPLYDINHMENDIGEGVFGEVDGKCIVDNWIEYYTLVKDKYNRRIERFRNIINDNKPIIILSRHSTSDVIELYRLITQYYNKNNIYIINSYTEIFENKNIININTEKNNIWNEATIWNEAINKYITNNL